MCAGIGIELIQNNEQLSDRCCNPCARKVRDLGQLHAFILNNANGQCKNPEKPKSANKRQLDTPNKSRPAWRKNKAARMCKPPTPKSRKCLNMSENIDPASSKKNIPRKDDYLEIFLNVDDLPEDGLQVKVVTRMANGQVIVRIPREEETKILVKHIALRNWRTALRFLFRHEEILPELKEIFQEKISKEFDEYVHKSKDSMEEIRVFCPLWYGILLFLF